MNFNFRNVAAFPFYVLSTIIMLVAAFVFIPFAVLANAVGFIAESIDN